ncbi:ADP-ribose pyrophosphatase YjhB (NUDIX family) [Kushneria sinocarnis]|uniref:ADP-ribose pyrophosphatase YjhB (NUDIX family) n=1 Tax=Kushneria sinocarnis TaxID=595502 RepID=A0A420WTB4_9GAMM|nr:NUDIX domain-containing protein [Kushneria sinocarnis]RKQ96332.1 ADP-ribose pyrophosphatase YjhB (NUDIX family) [Kushneria sinocarnis]
MNDRFFPHVTVASVIEHNGVYLLVEEPDRQAAHASSVYNQPAGHLEADEGLEAAARREALEESGWQITLTGYLGLYINTTPEGITYHSHTFLARPEQRRNTRLDDDIIAAHWLDYATIERLEQQQRLRSPLVLRRLQDARAGLWHPLTVIRDFSRTTTG